MKVSNLVSLSACNLSFCDLLISSFFPPSLYKFSLEILQLISFIDNQTSFKQSCSQAHLFPLIKINFRISKFTLFKETLFYGSCKPNFWLHMFIIFLFLFLITFLVFWEWSFHLNRWTIGVLGFWGVVSTILLLIELVVQSKR